MAPKDPKKPRARRKPIKTPVIKNIKQDNEINKALEKVTKEMAKVSKKTLKEQPTMSLTSLALAKMAASISKTSDAMYRMAVNTKDTIIEGIKDYNDAIREDFHYDKQATVAMSLASISPVFGHFVAKFMETSMYRKMVDSVKNGFNKAITSIASNIKNLLMLPFSLIKKGYMSTKSFFSSIFSKLGFGGKSKVAKIDKKKKPQRLAGGGLTKREGLAYLHSSEIVTPVNKLFKEMQEATEPTRFYQSASLKILTEVRDSLRGMPTFFERFTNRLWVGFSTRFSRTAKLLKYSWKTFATPFKFIGWLFRGRGGYKAMLPRGKKATVLNTLGTTFVWTMEKFDTVIDYLNAILTTNKDIATALTGNKYIGGGVNRVPGRYTIAGRLANIIAAPFKLGFRGAKWLFGLFSGKSRNAKVSGTKVTGDPNSLSTTNAVLSAMLNQQSQQIELFKKQNKVSNSALKNIWDTLKMVGMFLWTTVSTLLNKFGGLGGLLGGAGKATGGLAKAGGGLIGKIFKKFPLASKFGSSALGFLFDAFSGYSDADEQAGGKATTQQKIASTVGGGLFGRGSGFGNALQQALKWGMAGAGVGSLGGGIGAIPGAVVGGLIGGVSGYFGLGDEISKKMGGNADDITVKKNDTSPGGLLASAWKLVGYPVTYLKNFVSSSSVASKKIVDTVESKDFSKEVGLTPARVSATIMAHTIGLLKNVPYAGATIDILQNKIQGLKEVVRKNGGSTLDVDKIIDSYKSDDILENQIKSSSTSTNNLGTTGFSIWGALSSLAGNAFTSGPGGGYGIPGAVAGAIGPMMWNGVKSAGNAVGRFLGFGTGGNGGSALGSGSGSVIGGINWSRYAEASTDITNMRNNYNKVAGILPNNPSAGDINKFIQSINPNSPYANSGQAFIDAANKHGLDPRAMLARMLTEQNNLSSTGRAARNLNPGNVKLRGTARHDEQGHSIFDSAEEGIAAFANVLAKRKVTDVTPAPSTSGMSLSVLNQTANDLASGKISAENCGDAAALLVNNQLRANGGTNFLPRGGLDAGNLMRVASSYGSPILKGNQITMDSLKQLGAGTIIRFDRGEGHPDRGRYGPNHAETLLQDPVTKQWGILSYSDPRYSKSGPLWKPLNEKYMNYLSSTSNAIAANPLAKAIQGESPVDRNVLVNAEVSKLEALKKANEAAAQKLQQTLSTGMSNLSNGMGVLSNNIQNVVVNNGGQQNNNPMTNGGHLDPHIAAILRGDLY